MHVSNWLTSLVFILALSGCGDDNSNASREGQTNQPSKPATEVDRDPTPQTGTGGPSQSETSGQTSN